MGANECRGSLERLLNSVDHEVVALTGPWGTGKSHLWESISKKSDNPKISDALYVSLFGSSSIGDLKLKLLRSVVLKSKHSKAFGHELTSLLKPAMTALKGANAGFSALEDLALMALPKALKEKLIVIDDVERKNSSLNVDEVLGFIDECKNQYGCRFLLILNDDQLHDQVTWVNRPGFCRQSSAV